MTYNRIRNEIKSGDVLAWTHKGWSSWYDIQLQIVRLATQSEYSHIGVAWVIGQRVFVIEAVSPLVRIYPLSKEIPFYWIPCGFDYWDNNVEEYALSKIGDKYSKIDAIKAFFNKITAGEDKEWQCAELVNSLLISGGIFKQDEVISTPTRVVEGLQKKGYPTFLISE